MSAHEYFERNETTWNIKEFLEFCNFEPFDKKSITDRKLAKQWDIDRSSTSTISELAPSKRDSQSDDDFQPSNQATMRKKRFSLKKNKSVNVSPVNVSPTGVSPTNISPVNISPINLSFANVSLTNISPAIVSPTDVSPVNVSPSTPIEKIHSTRETQELLKKLQNEKTLANEPICSNIIDTTNIPLMKRLGINQVYSWVPVVNETTKYIDELIANTDTRPKLRNKLQNSYISPDEMYEFNKHYEKNWAHSFANKILSFFEAPRNPLLDKNSEGWLNCHILSLLIDDCFMTCDEIQVHRGEEMSLASIERKNLSREESNRKQYGHKIDIVFRIDDSEYFSSETYIDEDLQNLKPISYKHKILREMKDQLDRLLKKLKFTSDTIKELKNITIYGLNQGGLNGKIYVMYYDVDLQYYFVFETCRYRIGTTWGSVPESLASLKDILSLKFLIISGNNRVILSILWMLLRE
ncbi:hypothetical protein RhiirA4_427144 [Rhizophagus irregularis]|uniref:Uncharacterized protein n=1 Tax=Rhizophagus irregularis TaxID=588596 RepID=A0A2I1H7U7_9GLOM|nr:hypothetical protein RhiirA4_427144 [Rhizophagus irregularis]